MSRPNLVQDQIEIIQDCNNAITVIAKLLIEFGVDSDAGNEIPKFIKSNYVKGGLLAAIKIAAVASEEAIEWIDTELGLDLGTKNDGGGVQ